MLMDKAEWKEGGSQQQEGGLAEGCARAGAPLSVCSTVNYAQVNYAEQEQPGTKEGELCEPTLGKF